MNRVFEKIMERLKEEKEYSYADFDKYVNMYSQCLDSEYDDFFHRGLERAMKIVQEEDEEYNNGWIPCSEHPPKECVPVNVTWINRNPESYYAKIKDVPFSATAVYYNSKWYWYSSTCVDYLREYGKNDFDLVDKDIDIIAWQPIPQPYTKGE